MSLTNPTPPRPSATLGDKRGLEHISGPLGRAMDDLRLKMAARAVVDATQQDAAGRWIITGDGELLITALAEALEQAA